MWECSLLFLWHTHIHSTQTLQLSNSQWSLSHKHTSSLYHYHSLSLQYLSLFFSISLSQHFPLFCLRQHRGNSNMLGALANLSTLFPGIPQHSRKSDNTFQTLQRLASILHHGWLEGFLVLATRSHIIDTIHANVWALFDVSVCLEISVSGLVSSVCSFMSEHVIHVLNK